MTAEATDLLLDLFFVSERRDMFKTQMDTVRLMQERKR
jgi:hypothetical protein